MGPPDVPFEFDVLFGFDHHFGVVFDDRSQIHYAVVVEALIEIFTEAVVISLGVESNQGRF